jgi:hypothetical protein
MAGFQLKCIKKAQEKGRATYLSTLGLLQGLLYSYFFILFLVI